MAVFTPEKTPETTPPEAYKERIDKSPEWANTYACARWALIGECEEGHAFAKRLMCGKETCPDCGENWSWIHQRRFARWAYKVTQMDTMGYFVIEWPKASRNKLRSREALQDMGKRIKGAMMALGFNRGLRRWHFFGDDGANRGYNPHLNILVDGQYLRPDRLENIKSYLRSVLNEPKLIVNYSYRRSPAEMVHSLKYVTRSTFRSESWDEPLARDLHGFKNAQVWGTWKNEPVWEISSGEADGVQLSKVESLEQGICPRCGKPLKWSTPIPALLLEVYGGKDIGGGFVELPDPRDPPDRLSSEDLTGIDAWRHGLDTVVKNIVENNRDRPSMKIDACQLTVWPYLN